MLVAAKAGDLVELLFDDFTTQDDGWLSTEQVKAATPATIRLVGLFLSQDERVAKVAFCMADDKAVGTFGMIPLGYIKSMRVIEHVSDDQK